MTVGAIVGMSIGIGVICLLIGLVAGFYFTKKAFEKQLKENPPITEKQIRAMYMQMGRKPSESQIKATMRAMQNSK